MQHRHHPAAATPSSDTAAADLINRGKKRGGYNCGRCGLPKKGHSCHVSSTQSADAHPPSSTSFPRITSSADLASLSSLSAACPPLQRPKTSQLRRALSFHDFDVRGCKGDAGVESDQDEPEECLEGGLWASCLWEVMRKLPPADLSVAAQVSRGWRDTSKRIWRAVEELRLRVPATAQVGFVGSVLQKCPGLAKLSLRMERDVDSTMLACIAFSCPDLEYLEISVCAGASNRITGDALGRFVADKRCLTCLKMEGCSSLGGLVLNSSSLSTLWLSNLHSLSKTVLYCPNLKEISMEFSSQGNDATDLTNLIDCLGRSCPKLQNIHIASARLSNAVVLALTAANLRGLQMLSLVLGQEITDAAVAAIASSYPNLELLDLSGSSISDGGIGMICNVFPRKLSRLLLALCPNITSSGIQFATAQLPLLELLDCGMAIHDTNAQNLTSDEGMDGEKERRPTNQLHLMYQKLIIKHNRLKKLSLWGCSGLDALYLNCPQLRDLNLISCSNLYPDRLLIQCPSLENVHASGCQELLIKAIKNQVNANYFFLDNHFPNKRLADGSKRVQVPPHMLCQQHLEDDEKPSVAKKQCNVLIR